MNCEYHNVLTLSLIEYCKLKPQLDIDVHSILQTRATLYTCIKVAQTRPVVPNEEQNVQQRIRSY